MCTCCGESLGFESSRLDPTALCRMCRMTPPQFAQAVAYGQYTGALREMVGLFKFERVAALAPLMGSKIAESIALLKNPPKQMTVIAVPLFRSKQRQRGYNQSRLLANETLRQLRKDGAQLELTTAHDALQRLRGTESNHSLTPRQRRLNLRGAFKVADKAAVAGKDILLIDDIYTTGATARECSRVLMRAGANSVRVATLARAQRDVPTVWTGKIAQPKHFNEATQATN